MPEDNEEFEMLRDGLSAKAGPKSFSPEQLVACQVCSRANPPTRPNCLYCGATLPPTDANKSFETPVLRSLEKPEQGYNCILLPPKPLQLLREQFEELAGLLQLEPETLRQILESEKPLPLAHVATPDEAALIEERLGKMGLRVLLLPDRELLSDEAPPKRLRALEFKDDALMVQPTGGGGPISLLYTDVLLFVLGRIFVKQLEMEERKGRGAEQEIVSASETSRDEAVLDVYSARGDGCWRIAANNFDFSCVGPQKRLVAAENFMRLAAMLRSQAPQAAFDDSYSSVRRLLSAVWRTEQQTESSALHHGLQGRFNTRSLITTHNEAQFTRYSRLLYYFKVHGPDVIS